MKLSKEELSAKINDLDIDEEVKISLLEELGTMLFELNDWIEWFDITFKFFDSIESNPSS